MDKDVVMEIIVKAGGHERKLFVAGANASEKGIDMNSDSMNVEELVFVHSFLLDCIDSIEEVFSKGESESIH